MKFLLSVAAVIAVAVAVPAQRGLVLPGPAGPVPAPEFEPIAVGPAVLPLEPIAVGPAILDPFEPIAVGPAIIPFEPVDPSPVAIVDGGDAPEVASGTPLVQIILNINTAAFDVSPIAVGPAIVEATPVQVVDVAPEPVQVVEVAPTPIQVIEVAPAPVQIIETNPAPAEPISIGTPVLPVQIIESNPAPVEPISIGTPVLPAIILPEELN